MFYALIDLYIMFLCNVSNIKFVSTDKKWLRLALQLYLRNQEVIILVSYLRGGSRIELFLSMNSGF